MSIVTMITAIPWEEERGGYNRDDDEDDNNDGHDEDDNDNDDNGDDEISTKLGTLLVNPYHTFPGLKWASIT